MIGFRFMFSIFDDNAVVIN